MERGPYRWPNFVMVEMPASNLRCEVQAENPSRWLSWHIAQVSLVGPSQQLCGIKFLS